MESKLPAVDLSVLSLYDYLLLCQEPQGHLISLPGNKGLLWYIGRVGCPYGGNDVIEVLRFWQSHRVHSDLRISVSRISAEARWYQSNTLHPAADTGM